LLKKCERVRWDAGVKLSTEALKVRRLPFASVYLCVFTHAQQPPQHAQNYYLENWREHRIRQRVACLPTLYSELGGGGRSL